VQSKGSQGEEGDEDEVVVSVPFMDIKCRLITYFLFSILFLFSSSTTYTFMRTKGMLDEHRKWSSLDGVVKEGYEVALYLQMLILSLSLVWYAYFMDSSFKGTE